MILNLVGFAAATISFIMWLPQAITTWKHRNNPQELRGISKGTHYFVLANAVLWGVYGVMSGSYWAGAPGLINFPLSALTLILIRRATKTGIIPGSSICECGWEGGTHMFFVTSPPGFGTIRPCAGNSRSGFPVPQGTAFDRAANRIQFPTASPGRPALTGAA